MPEAEKHWWITSVAYSFFLGMQGSECDRSRPRGVPCSLLRHGPIAAFGSAGLPFFFSRSNAFVTIADAKKKRSGSRCCRARVGELVDRTRKAASSGRACSEICFRRDWRRACARARLAPSAWPGHPAYFARSTRLGAAPAFVISPLKASVGRASLFLRHPRFARDLSHSTLAAPLSSNASFHSIRRLFHFIHFRFPPSDLQGGAQRNGNPTTLRRTPG